MEARLTAAALPPSRTLSIEAITLAVLAAAALALRLPAIGNPLFDIDEQFYLLVGDRMLGGAVPYVDIWDRKPIGLFLIYAAIRLLGGDGVVQYQAVATIAAIATAATIATIARRMTGAVPAAGAGLGYLVWANLLGGGGGQSPLFYNLATAVAALATLRAIDAPERARREGRVAMLAMGVAIQIKTSVVFEGCLFGLVFLWLDWTRTRRAAPVLAAAAQLVAIALAPTLVAFACYLAIGQAHAFWFANVTSIFLRVAPAHAEPAAKLAGVALVLAPLACVAVAGVALRRGEPAASFVGLWMAVATAGFLAVPPYYNHYALPLLVPFAAGAALAFASGLPWRALAGAGGAALLWLSGYPDLEGARAARARLATFEALIVPHLRGGCLFVFQGPPILYRATGACTVSRYVFPAHLNYQGEARAIGVDPAAATRAALAAAPAVIVTSGRGAIVDANPATWDLVEAALASDYRLVGSAVADRRRLGVYARR